MDAHAFIKKKSEEMAMLSSHQILNETTCARRDLEHKSRERESDENVALRSTVAMDTNRLSLRPIGQRGDAALIHPHITDNVTRLWIDWDTPKSLADTEASLADALGRSKAGKYAGWIAQQRFCDSEGAVPFIGYVSLERLPEPMRDAWFELNIWLAEAKWGKGYAYEMAAVVLDWVASRTDLRFVAMSWTHGNEGSRRVIEQLTESQEPYIHQALKNGAEVSVYHCVLDLDNWFRRQAYRRKAYL
jgi:RimJ/RimL family protein N-acetyltransferase